MLPTDLESPTTADAALIIPSCEMSPTTQRFLQRLAERNGTSIGVEAARILEASLANGQSPQA